MARALRMEVAGGRYLVTARGNERRNIFRDVTDRVHFVELLSELGERFGARVHGWVLMNNHYHLLLETPEANLSRSGQWLNLAYSVWFNRRHDRSGHLFQGRFGSVLVGDDASWSETARYVHLNPVRVAGLGLGKSDRQRQRSVAALAPGKEVVDKRLKMLRAYRWSSYPSYAGIAPAPAWLWTEKIQGAWGGRSRREQQRALRAYHEIPLREGRLESVWDRVVGGAVLGSAAFVASVRERLKSVPREVSQSATWRERVGWEGIVAAVEEEHGERWEEFRDRYGDWGRDLAIYFGRIQGRMKLRELAEKAGGLGIAATAQAVSRVRRQLAEEGPSCPRIRSIAARLSKSKM